MAGKIGNPLTDQKEIAANQQGQITKRQQSRLGGVFWQKKQRWFGIALASLVPTIGPLIGAVAALTSGRSDLGAWPIGLFSVSAGLFCVWLVPSVLIYSRWRWLDRNLARETIVEGEGMVYWKRRRYILELADGKKLDSIYSPDLLPGRYRFYYLPRYHWLLTAEPLEEVAQVDDLEQLNHRLARANWFQSSALVANQAGHLTGLQRVMILGRFAAYAIGGFVVVALFFGYLIYTDGLHEGLWGLVAVVVGMVVLSLYLGRKSLSAIADCLQGQVVTAEGPVVKDFEVSTDSSVSYYYELDKTIFRVNEAGYEALVAGLTYRLYLLPRSQKLVNIEVVGGLHV
jgi:MFS family permease